MGGRRRERLGRRGLELRVADDLRACRVDRAEGKQVGLLEGAEGGGEERVGGGEDGDS